MRARLLVLTALSLAALSLSSLAAAQPRESIDVERFKPAVTHDGFVTVEGSNVRPTFDRWEFGLFANYARNPLIVVDGNGDFQHAFVSGRLGLDAIASVTIAGPFALGLDVPFFLAQTGDGSPSFAGLGDVRLVPKLRLVDGTHGFGLALLAEVRAPTHVGDFAGGARMVVFAPRLAADYRTYGGFRIGANAGVVIREKTTFVNVEAGSELTYAVALGYRFGGNVGKVELGAEANGALGFAALHVAEAPLEALPYVKFYPGTAWEIVLGPGIGVVPGYGVPIVRAFAGVRYAPTTDDRDHDGVSDADDKCPDQPETRNGVDDTDGCPDEDRDDDHDGVPNSEDDCPKEKETINGIQDDDGCPDGGPAKVIREEGKILVTENIRFRTGAAQIDPGSYSILNQVALVMKANPDIKHMRVEGHTDETGSHERNMELSKQRADAVRDYLVRRGVRSDRLEARGYGPDRPLVSGTDPASRAKNRRVEFVLDD